MYTMSTRHRAPPVSVSEQAGDSGRSTRQHRVAAKRQRHAIQALLPHVVALALPRLAVLLLLRRVPLLLLIESAKSPDSQMIPGLRRRRVRRRRKRRREKRRRRWRKTMCTGAL